MTRLNEKIDDSYDDSYEEEEEINLKNFPTVNEFMNINSEYLKDQKNYLNCSDNISNERTKQNTMNNLSKNDYEKTSTKFNQTKSTKLIYLIKYRFFEIFIIFKTHKFIRCWSIQLDKN